MKATVKRQFDRPRLRQIHWVDRPRPRALARRRVSSPTSAARRIRAEREDGLRAVEAADHRLRVAVVEKAPMTCPLIRIDTNQGLVGWGEVRDGATETYALVLKTRLIGENPCNVDQVFRKIKQFGHHARQAGGVCGVEMACGSGRQGVGRAGVADARRQVPRLGAALCRHDGRPTPSSRAGG